MTPTNEPIPNLAETDGREEAGSAAALWLVLMKSYRSMQLYVESTIASMNIGLSDFMILELLLHKGSMPMSLIGKTVMLANPSMTAAVARLERLGFVTRQGGTVDRRVRTVALTDAGKAAVKAMYAQHQVDLEDVMVTISQGDRALARAVLKQLGLAAQAKLDPCQAKLAAPRPPRVG